MFRRYDLYFWLQENSYKYGFIFRYPGDKTDITGVAEEVWHYRYVGVEAATEMHEKGLCLEEYLAERQAYTLFGDKESPENFQVNDTTTQGPYDVRVGLLDESSPQITQPANDDTDWNLVLVNYENASPITTSPNW